MKKAKLIAGLCLLLADLSQAAPLPGYQLTDLGTLGGAESQAMGLNDLGQVVGWSTRNNRPECLASEQNAPCRYGFVWQQGQMQDLGHAHPDAERTYVVEINDDGIMVGYETDYYPLSGSITRPIKGDKQGLTLLAVAHENGGGQAEDINRQGEIVGCSYDEQGQQNLTVWHGKEMQLHAMDKEYYRRGLGINDSGNLVGYQYRPYSFRPNSALLYQHHVVSQLSDQSEVWSEAKDINNLGMVAGELASGPHRPPLAALWLPLLGGEMQTLELGTLKNYSASSLRGINDQGVAVGQAWDEDGHARAIIVLQGKLIDLNTLVSSQWPLISAEDINNYGQIAATALVNNQMRAVLLTQSPNQGDPLCRSNRKTCRHRIPQ